MNYRRDIDGLRAIAVVPVILFHAGFPMFSGGYVGVDIFFVISGYLITSLILQDYAAGNYSLQRFYIKRARRILPSLFFVVGVCIPFAWHWFLPYDLLDFSQSVVATLSFVSNIFFWLKTGYFDIEAEFKPLLHTWSLAVEEQYYLLFPLLIALLLNRTHKKLFWGLVLLALASLAFTQWGAYHAPSANFFLFPSRLWELAMGALLALHMRDKSNFTLQPQIAQALSLAGLGAILFAVFYFNQHTRYPSLYTLMPTLGTAAVILFSRPGSVSDRLLSTPVLVGLGLISYSAYLWHQPLLAFARYQVLGELSLSALCGIVLLTFFLAWTSWRFIERPFRNASLISNQKVIMIFCTSGLLLFTFGVAGHKTGGFPMSRTIGDLPSDYLLHANAIRKQNIGIDGALCISGGPSMCQVARSDAPAGSMLLLGDSHSADLTNQFKAFASSHQLNAWQMSITGCAFLITQLAGSKTCHAARDLLLSKIAENKFTDVLVVGNYFGHTNAQRPETRAIDIDALKSLMEQLLQAGVKVTFFIPRPSFVFSPLRAAAIGRLDTLRSADREEVIQEWRRTLQTLSSYPNFYVFDQDRTLLDAGCGAMSCFNGHTKNLLPLYRDNSHLTELGSQLVFDAFVQSYLDRASSARKN